MTDASSSLRIHSGKHKNDLSSSSKYSHWWQSKILEVIFLFIMIHYFFWIIGIGVIGFHMVQNDLEYLVLALFVVYLPSFFDNSQNNCGRPWHTFRLSRVWKWMSNYCQLEMISEEELDPSKRYLFGYHPHGILILSRCASYGGNWEALFPGIETRVLAASPMFYVPCAREICLWMGAVDASKSSAIKCFNSGLSLIVYPGGSKEIFETNPNKKETVLVLKERKGFIKLALQNGVNLVPTFVFGEKWMYDKFDPPKKLWKLFLNVFKIPLVVFWGRFYTWLPYRKKMGIVYGKAITVKRSEHPTEEEINKLHKEYSDAIAQLFHQYKSRFGYDEKEKLIIT